MELRSTAYEDFETLVVLTIMLVGCVFVRLLLALVLPIYNHIVVISYFHLGCSSSLILILIVFFFLAPCADVSFLLMMIHDDDDDDDEEEEEEEEEEEIIIINGFGVTILSIQVDTNNICPSPVPG